MIQLTASTKILLAVEPGDFRKGIDGFCAVCLNELDQDPRSGTYFVFINRSKTMIRILSYDTNGYFISTKRLSKGKFKGWPTGQQPMTAVEAKHLQRLLWGKYPIQKAAP